MLFVKRPNDYGIGKFTLRERPLVIIYQKKVFIAFKIWSGIVIGYFHQLF